MKITLFTSNNLRHNYLINLLSLYCDELWVVQENRKFFSVRNNEKYQEGKSITNQYFDNVLQIQKKIFKKNILSTNISKIKTLPISHGELSSLSLSNLDEFLKSDIYLVFGSSYIKGELIDFLINHKAINIHAGVSPYYRGADCNFWALYDGNPHLVGTTIHLLSKGLDEGPILYHAMSNIKTNPYEYTMSSIKSAFHSLTEKIKDGSIFELKPLFQDKIKEIRYSRKSDFSEEIVKKYFEKKIDLKSKKFNVDLLKEPYFFNN